jgi:LysR family transcriptional regulator, regulator for genes of the gallate degradation pathway
MADALNLNLRHLDAIAEIGRAGSMSAGAQRVNLSQPALAQAVSKVERALGERLFERQPGGMVPTEAGRILIIRIERSFHYLIQAVRLIRRSARLAPLAHIERRVTMAQLRALIAVESTSSYAMAAQQIGLSQPAVHRAVRDLQQFLGTQLLVRVGRSVRPTDAASRFVRFARLMLAELRAGLDEVEALTAGDGGRIELGTLPMARAVFLPDLLTQFITAHPAASVRVIEAPYGELLNSLRQGDIDMFIGGALRDPAPTNDIVQEVLFDDEQVIVGNADHPLCRKKHLSPADLLCFPWIVPSHGVPMRTNWERMFRSQGVEPPKVRIECGSMLIARGLMLNGTWLTLMSRDQIRLERMAGVLAEIEAPGDILRRRIVLTRRHDWRATPLQAHLVDMAHQLAKRRRGGATA